MSSKGENYAKYLVKGSAVAFGALVATALLGLVMRMFLSRALSVEDYGLFFAVLSFVSFFTMFRGAGFPAAIAKYIPQYRAEERFTELKSTIITSTLGQIVAGLLIAAVFIIFSKQIALGLFGTATAIPIIQVLSIWFVVMLFVSTGNGIFQGFRDIPSQQSVRLLRVLPIFLLIAIFSYIVDLKSIDIAIIYLIASPLTLTWIIFRLRKHRSTLKKGKISITKPLTKKLVLFGLPLILAGAAGSIITYTDTILITTFRSLEEVGLYQVALPASRSLLYFSAAIAAPLLPMISEFWAKGKEEAVQRTLYYLTKFSFLLMMPALLVFLVFPDVIINIAFGTGYVGATAALQILSIGATVGALAQFTATTLAGMGRTLLLAKIMGAAASLNFVGNTILIPILGIEGAAITTLLTFLLIFVLRFHYARKIIKFPVPKISLIKIIIGSALTLLIIIFLKLTLPLPLWPKIFAVLVPAALFYLLWVLHTKILVEGDLKIIRETLPVPEWLMRILKKLI